MRENLLFNIFIKLTSLLNTFIAYNFITLSFLLRIYEIIMLILLLFVYLRCKILTKVIIYNALLLRYESRFLALSLFNFVMFI